MTTWLHWTEKESEPEDKCIPYYAGDTFLYTKIEEDDSFSSECSEYFGMEIEYDLYEEVQMIFWSDVQNQVTSYSWKIFEGVDDRELKILMEKAGVDPPDPPHTDYVDVIYIGDDNASTVAEEMGYDYYFTVDQWLFRQAHNTTYTWDNNAGTGFWNNQGNWTDGVTPHLNGFPDDNGDKADFDATSVANCTMNAALTVGEVDIAAGYTGTITQSANFIIDDAGAHNGAFTLSDGAWDCVSYDFSTDTQALMAGDNFDCGSGTMQFAAPAYTGDYGLRTQGTVVFDGESSTINASSMAFLLSTVTLSSGINTISSYRAIPENIGFYYQANTTFDDGDGTLTFTRNGNQYFYSLTNGTALTLYNLTLNGGAGQTVKWANGRSGDLTCNNDLSVTQGVLDTSEATSGTSRNLNVENDYTNAATSTWNDSVITLGDAGHACALDNTGGTINVDTATIYAGDAGQKFIATGNNWDWDSGPGTVQVGLGDFRFDITTGGGTCTFEFVDDCTIDEITVTANDTLKCVTANKTITGNAAKDITVWGTLELTGASGQNVAFTGYRTFWIEDGGTVDIQYVSLTTTAITSYALIVGTGGAITVTQIDNITTSSANRAGFGANSTNVITATNSSFSGADGSDFFDQDIYVNTGGTMQLDTCTYSTVGMQATSGWIVDKDGSSNFTIYGNLASSETPSAGYRAADITGNLTISNADAYTTPFNTSYTLGANCTNVDTCLINQSTTFDTDSGNDYSFSSSLQTRVDGTFNCNGSTCQFGAVAYEADFGLRIFTNGTFNGGGGTHSMSSFYLSVASGTATLTSGVTTLTGKRGAALDQSFRVDAGTFDDGNGTITITETTNTTLYHNTNGATTFYNFIINGGATVQFFNAKGFALTVANNLTITSGTFDTSETVSGTSRDLTVENDYTNADTSTWNDSVITLGDVGHACALDNTGGTINVDTATIYAGDAGQFFVVTGNDLNWDSSGGTCNIKWGDFDPDITTGGGGINVTIDGDISHDAVTVSVNDTITCTTNNTTITGDGLSVWTINGAIQLNAAAGNEIDLANQGQIIAGAGSTFDWQYVDAVVSVSLQFANGAVTTITQFDNCSVDGSASAFCAVSTQHTTTTIPITNSTLTGPNGAGYLAKDVCILTGASMALDNCTLGTDTVGLQATSGWLCSLDHNTVAGDDHYWGQMSTADAPAGYRAVNWAAGSILRLRNADAYSTPFQTIIEMDETGVNAPAQVLKDPNTQLRKAANSGWR